MSFVVSIQNMKLFKDKIVDEIHHKKQKTKERMLKAQINEYLYDKLRKSGIAKQVDLDVGLQFFYNIENTRSSTTECCSLLTSED